MLFSLHTNLKMNNQEQGIEIDLMKDNCSSTQFIFTILTNLIANSEDKSNLSQTKWILKEGTWTIGSDSKQNLVLNSKSILKQHATLGFKIHLFS